MLNTDLKYNLVKLSEHSHCADEIKLNKVMSSNSIEANSWSSTSTQRNIVVSTANDIRTRQPYNFVEARKLVLHYRKNNFTYVDNYDIPEEFRTTLSEKQFLFYDYGIENEERIINFTEVDIIFLFVK